MRTLAIIGLVFWALASVVFENWRRAVAYPERTFAVRLTTSLHELSFAALAVWVIVVG